MALKNSIPWNKGRKGVSKYTSEKMRLKKKGIPLSKKHKENISKVAKEKGFGKWMIGKKLSEETKIKLRAENSGRWKGDDAKIGSIHIWIIRKYGQPKFCEICKSTNKNIYDWSNKDHKYSRNIIDWQRVCRKCHHKYDIENNNSNMFGRY